MVYSQYSESIFEKAPAANETEVSKSSMIQADVPADPPAPVPIDNFLPFLIITAIGLIFWQNKKYSLKSGEPESF
ncbi:hypothetical protein KADA111694_00090 [Kaistella daneshvariae]